MIDKSPIIAAALSAVTTQISDCTSSKECSSGINFEWVKRLALDLLLSQLTQAIELLAQLHCCGKSYFTCIKLPHKIFSWSLQDCLSRRQFELNWLSILQKVLTPRCMEEKKIQVDYQEILRFVQTFLDSYKKRGDKQQLDTMALLHDIETFEVIENTLMSEFKENQAIYRELRQQLNASKFVGGSLCDFVDINHDDDFSNAYIEMVSNNYHKTFENTRCYQEQLKCQIIETKLDNKIYESDMRLGEEDLRNFNVIAALRFEISFLKERIETMNNKFAVDYEAVNDENFQIQFQLERINDSRKYKSEQLLQFHKALKEERLRVLKMERIAAEKLALEKTAKLAAALSKGKRKRKRTPSRKRTPNRKPGLSGKQKKV